MTLLCLSGMPQSKENMRIDVITEKGIIETVVVKPTPDGFALFEGDEDDAEKLMDIRRAGSPTSFTVSGSENEIDLKKIFPAYDFRNIKTASDVELKAVIKGGGFVSFKLKRSGGTFYVSESAGFTYSIHK